MVGKSYGNGAVGNCSSFPVLKYMTLFTNLHERICKKKEIENNKITVEQGFKQNIFYQHYMRVSGHSTEIFQAIKLLSKFPVNISPSLESVRRENR